MSMTWQCWAKRSTRATTQAAPGKTEPHCLKARLVVTTTERCSWRRETMFVEQVGRARVAGQVAKLIADQEMGSGVALEAALERGEGLLLEQVGESGSEGAEAHRVALLQCFESQVLRQRGLADTGLAAKEDVLAGAEEVEGEELLVEGAVDRARMVPVEAVEGGEAAESGAFGAGGEIAALALLALGGNECGAGRAGSESVLLGISEELLQRLAGETQAERVQAVDQVLGVVSRRHRRSCRAGGGRPRGPARGKGV